MIIILSGPGGAGKGTVARHLVKRNPNIYLSRSWTTRPCRKDEPKDAYKFVDRQAFEREIETGGMLEWIEFGEHYYGTPYSELKLDDGSGGDIFDMVLLEIDVQGAKKVRELHPDRTTLIFLEAPTPEDQQKRLQKRGDTIDHVKKRMETAAREREDAKKLEAKWIINDDLDSAISEIENLIRENSG